MHYYPNSQRLGQMFFWWLKSFRQGNFSFYNKTLVNGNWRANLVGKYSDDYSKIIGNWHSIGNPGKLVRGLFIITPQAGEVEGNRLFLSELILYTKHGFYAKYKLSERDGMLFTQHTPTVESKLSKPFEQR
jgi:hypothetical protein